MRWINVNIIVITTIFLDTHPPMIAYGSWQNYKMWNATSVAATASERCQVTTSGRAQCQKIRRVKHLVKVVHSRKGWRPLIDRDPKDNIQHNSNATNATLNTLTLHTPSQYQRLMRVVKGDSGKKARRLSTSISAEIPMSVLNIISKNPPIVAYGRRWWSRHSRKQGSRQPPTEHIRYNTNEAIMPICSLLFDVWYKYEL